MIDLASGKPDIAKQRLLELVKTHDNARAHMMLAEYESSKGGSPDVVIQHICAFFSWSLRMRWP